MNHIVALHIEGFKKFMRLDVKFNEHMNIVVGENESGKSTILEAITIVLQQQYKTADKSILKDLFNIDMVNRFKENPSVATLPYILIELEMELDPNQRTSSNFNGENYSYHRNNEVKYGIKFECKFDNQEGDAAIGAIITEGKIPYEYYDLSWKTFANITYQSMRKPLHFLSIDTSNTSTTSSFNYYNRTLFTSIYDEDTRLKAKNEFRTKLEKAFEETHLDPIDTTRKFGIDSKKVLLESILSVYENSIALENRGSGMESYIKTQIALNRESKLNVVLIEEPENHLCFSTLRKMLEEISNQQVNSQIIVTTHNNLIASGLNLNNVLWITDNEVKSLDMVNQNVAKFFVKADNNAFLQLLLSKKAILVEGATECLLLPYFYKKVTGHTVDEDGVAIISCNGISYKKYLDIAIKTDKRVAVITDNDKNLDKLSNANTFNENHELQHIFMDTSPDNWTWEICIYNVNKEALDEIVSVEEGAEYRFHGQNYGAVQGKMLNNKVDVAYQMLTSQKDFVAPEYIKEAITWIKN